MERLSRFLIRSRRSIRIILSQHRVKIRVLISKKHGASTWCFSPCCQRSFTRFLDWSKHFRDVVCPCSGSEPRHRSLIPLSQHEKPFRLNGPIQILYIAPADCLKNLIDQNKNIQSATANLNNPSEDIKIDITQIPCEGHTFDIVFCNHVLEHILEDRKTMKKLFRVVKPNGWTSLQVPIKRKLDNTFEDSTVTSPQDRLSKFGQEDHVRWHRRDFPQRLTETGFHVSIMSPAQSIRLDDIRELRLRRAEDLFVGTKP